MQNPIQSAVLSGNDVVEEIRSLFLDSFSINIDDAEMDLFDTGVLDSMMLVQLVVQLEKRFDLELPFESLELQSFSSVEKIAQLIATPRGSA